MNRRPCYLMLAVLVLVAGCATPPADGPLVTTDHLVDHVSTVAANAGQKVGLFVRQKAARTVSASQRSMRGRVVLFVHGGTVPSVPDYDLDFKTYNWMAHLARAGFNVYAMDHSGYGGSPRPMMDDACNLDPKEQKIVMPRPLKGPCLATYLNQFNTIRNDWAEIDAVVDHLRRVNNVERVHLIGWSAGGPRVGGYVALHPQKIDRVMLYAPSPTIAGPLPDKPGPGFPLTLQTREEFEKKRWDPEVRCPGQLDPEIRPAVWRSIMQWDKVGASWGPPEGVMRGRTATQFGWTRDLAASVKAPTLVMVGEYDRPAERRTVYEQLGSSDKVFVKVACASHFMLWEKQHRALHDASLEWLRDGRLKGVKQGEMVVDADGNFRRLEAR